MRTCIARFLVAVSVVMGLQNLALGQICLHDGSDQFDLVWAPALDIALKLPSPSKFYRTDAYSSYDYWDTPHGQASAKYGMAPVSWWSKKSRKICSSTIDGFPAVVYEWWTEDDEHQMGVMFGKAPFGEELLVEVPLPSNSQSDRRRALAELLSIRFVNDARKIVLVEIVGGKTAVFVNEIGQRIEVDSNETLTALSGWVIEIREDSVLVQEPFESDYVYHTYKISPGK